MENCDKLARAIRGLTLALWCWMALQVLMYVVSLISFESRISGAMDGSSSSSGWERSSQPDPNEGYDADFDARPMKDKVRLASAVLLVEMKKVDGVHRAVVQEILKLQPGIRLYYQVGDNFDDLSHSPAEECDSCTSDSHELVFMQGNPARMRYATTSLGGMTIDELRRLAQESPSTAPASKP